MEFLEQEIVTLLKHGPMHAGTSGTKLNGFPFGLDVSQDEVLRVLRQLEATYVVESPYDQ